MEEQSSSRPAGRKSNRRYRATFEPNRATLLVVVGEHVCATKQTNSQYRLNSEKKVKQRLPAGAPNSGQGSCRGSSRKYMHRGLVDVGVIISWQGKASL